MVAGGVLDVAPSVSGTVDVSEPSGRSDGNKLSNGVTDGELLVEVVGSCEVEVVGLNGARVSVDVTELSTVVDESPLRSAAAALSHSVTNLVGGAPVGVAGTVP